MRWTDRFGHGRPVQWVAAMVVQPWSTPPRARQRRHGCARAVSCHATAPARPFGAKPLLPAPDDGLGLSGSPLDLAGAWPSAVSERSRPARHASANCSPIGYNCLQLGARSAAVSLNWVLFCILQPRTTESAGDPQKKRKVRLGRLSM
jgi:hypothetical protein